MSYVSDTYGITHMSYVSDLRYSDTNEICFFVHTSTMSLIHTVLHICHMSQISDTQIHMRHVSLYIRALCL